jgi:superfamily II DNA helicase RecQ
MLDRLESGGFLRARRLEHGGVVLDLTHAGKAALQDPGALDDLVRAVEKSSGRGPAEGRREPSKKATKKKKKKDETGLVVDESLFQKLRTWRLEQARAQDTPPFIIFHDSHLRIIAAHRPVTLEALAELRGVGPVKLERYGEVVIELVGEHLGEETDNSQG